MGDITYLLKFYPFLMFTSGSLSHREIFSEIMNLIGHDRYIRLNLILDK